jgi:hypothetical protein
MATRESEAQQKLLRVVRGVKPIAPSEQYPADQSGQTRLFSPNPQVEALLQYLKADFDARNDTLASELKETNEKLTKTNEQMSRVGTTLDRVLSKFEEKVVTGVCPDIMVSPHEPGHADVTLVESSLPAELSYPCTTAELAGYVGIHHSRLGYYFRLAGIQGDPTYHYAFRTGKSSVNKYKLRALKGLYDYVIENSPSWIKKTETASIQRYLILHSGI